MTYDEMLDCFSKDLYREALIGKGKYLMINPRGYEDGHARGEVLDNMTKWASRYNIEQMKEGIFGTINELIKDDDLRALLSFVWAILWNLEKRRYNSHAFISLFNYDPHYLVSKIFPYLSSKFQIIDNNKDLKQSFLLVCSKCPELCMKFGYAKIVIIEDKENFLIREIKPILIKRKKGDVE